MMKNSKSARYWVGAMLTFCYVAACASGGGNTSSGGSGGAPEPMPNCEASSIGCDGDRFIVCDDEGQISLEKNCADEGLICSPLFGCQVCAPQSEVCEDGIARRCDSEGESFVEFECDPHQGLSCTSEGCLGACAPDQLLLGNEGCDFYPTVTPNGVHKDWFDFAAVVANASSEDANVIVHRGALEITTEQVPAGSAKVIILPWVPSLKGPEGTANGMSLYLEKSVHEPVGAYRLRSDRPVSVYQFNALRYENTASDVTLCPDLGGFYDGCYSFTNDASILLPAHALTSNYVVMGWHNETGTPGQEFVSVTATEDDTVIEVRLSAASTMAGAGVPLLEAGQIETFNLNRGDVMQLVTHNFWSLSGTIITSPNEKPFQLIGGFPSATVPSNSTCCADHLEETILPVEALGKSYVVAPPEPPENPTTPGVAAPPTRLTTIHIHGIHPNTTVSFNPELMPPLSLQAGEVFKLEGVTEAVHIAADQAIGINSYMHGADDAGDGDPSQSIAVATEQYRERYVFVAPKDYDFNRVSVVAPQGSRITLDGELISQRAFQRIGSTELGVARVALKPTEIHKIEGNQPFGIEVYGYGAYTSYMYPGGMALEKISPPPELN